MNDDEKPGEFMVPVERQQQIGVTYAAIQKQPFTHSVRAWASWPTTSNGIGITSRVSRAMCKELFVFSRGELVEKDAPLLTIYSPDLLTTQNEFVDLLKTRDEAQDQRQASSVLESTTRLVESARERLRLWNINGRPNRRTGKDPQADRDCSRSIRPSKVSCRTLPWTRAAA